MVETGYILCRQCGSVNRVSGERKDRPVCGRCGTPLDLMRATSERPLEVTDANFSHEVLEAGIPVLIDFFATWCGACRSLEPSIEAVASRYKGKLKVGTLDVERNPQSAGKYEIKATPTLVLFRDGQLAERVTGALPERELERFVEKYVS